MRKHAVSVTFAEPVRSIAVAACAVASISSAADALDPRYEDGDGTSSWNTRTG